MGFPLETVIVVWKYSWKLRLFCQERTIYRIRGEKFTNSSADVYGVQWEILERLELPKFDSRKPAGEEICCNCEQLYRSEHRLDAFSLVSTRWLLGMRSPRMGCCASVPGLLLWIYYRKKALIPEELSWYMLLQCVHHLEWSIELQGQRKKVNRINNSWCAVYFVHDLWVHSIKIYD